MVISTLDWGIVISFFAITLGIGIWTSRTAGKSSKEYFLSGRSMPWWLLGISMVATTFSTDTPNLVTELVRKDGVSGNWVWWAFLLTGLLTVFVYAKLWRKSEVETDIEFYELRYGGRAAEFLRGFRAVYLGLFFNVLAMAGVCLAAIKIGEVMLGLSPYETIGIAAVVTAIFSSLGGLRGVIYTDLLLFIVSMIGSVGAAIVAVNHPKVGGLGNLLSNEAVQSKMSMLPDFSDPNAYVPILIIPLAVQWWSSWYPGAEPGGGGYVAQRMLAAKDEEHAMKATLFFNIAHYALRPWPWILVALASIVVFPNADSIVEAFPQVSEAKIGEDLGYPAMLTFLPMGLIGLVLASLIAAFMSTISTHLNWGASYMVNDVYKRFFNNGASEKELVTVGRIVTILLMFLSAVFAFFLESATQIFQIILMFGAGTGLIFILRWFWWRINAWSEIVAMFSSGIISILFTKLGDNWPGLYPESWPDWGKFPLIVGITTILWLVATFLTQAESKKVLKKFYLKIQPGGPGWEKVVRDAYEEGEIIYSDTQKWTVPRGILSVLIGTVCIYSSLFATGYLIYGQWTMGGGLVLLALLTGAGLVRVWPKDEF
ncbi:MAG: Na+:solute symporter [Bacteroidia bacterium]|nr:Na+:solute symporter [Bacteroidia bacterium]